MSGVTSAGAIGSRLDDVARRSVELLYERVPALGPAYGDAGRDRCLEDARFHLRFLLAALVVDDVRIFTDYAEWATALLDRYGVERSHLADAFGSLAAAIAERAPEAAEAAAPVLGAGEAALDAA